MDKLVKTIRKFYQQETRDPNQLILYRTSSIAKIKIKCFIEALQRSMTEQTVGACYESIADEYVDLFFDPFVQSVVLASIVHFIEKRQATRILDAGCGIGLEACFLAHHFPNANITATDISHKMIREARARIARLGLCNVSSVVAAHSALSKTFRYDSFDFVYVFGSFHFITDEDCQENFAALASILVAGGMLLICGPMHADGELYQRSAYLKGFQYVGPVKSINLDRQPRVQLWRFVKS